ncbi:hypothetical protein GCM10009828_039480 [Actinoplanes couchii]
MTLLCPGYPVRVSPARQPPSARTVSKVVRVFLPELPPASPDAQRDLCPAPPVSARTADRRSGETPPPPASFTAALQQLPSRFPVAAPEARTPRFSANLLAGTPHAPRPRNAEPGSPAPRSANDTANDTADGRANDRANDTPDGRAAGPDGGNARNGGGRPTVERRPFGPTITEPTAALRRGRPADLRGRR